jgi:RimK family alpha-L-glutamate ligase
VRVCVLATEDSWYYQELASAFAARGADVARREITEVVAACGMGTVDAPRRPIGLGPATNVRLRPIGPTTPIQRGLDDFDVVVVRSIPAGSLEQIIFRMNVLRMVELGGVWVFNPARVIETTVDKYYTSALLAAAGLPTPPTIVVEDRQAATDAFEELGGDVVVKPLFGSLGRGMVRVESADIAYRVFQALEMGNYVFYLQRFIPHANRDIRAFVLGDRVLAAMERIGESWKTNVAQGATARWIELSPEAEDLAIRAARVIGAPYAGVDLMLSEDGELFVIEVNGIPGWQGLQQVCPFSIAEEVVSFIMAQGGKSGE